MTAANVKFDSVALWIQIWGAPFDMVSPIVAAEIGNHMGEVVEVEKRMTQDTQNFFMRVKVALPTSKAYKVAGISWWFRGTTNMGDFQVREAPNVLSFLQSVGS